MSFCTTEMQHSWDNVKGRGSISGVSLAVVDSESRGDRGHSVVRRRRMRSLKCCEEERDQFVVRLKPTSPQCQV